MQSILWASLRMFYCVAEKAHGYASKMSQKRMTDLQLQTILKKKDNSEGFKPVTFSSKGCCYKKEKKITKEDLK